MSAIYLSIKSYSKFILIILFVHCSLRLDDLRSQNNFLLDLDVSVCFDIYSCDVNVSVLSNTKLPKRSCDWSAGLQGKLTLIKLPRRIVL